MKTLVFAESELAARELCGGARRYTDEVVYATFCEPQTGIADECVVVSVPDGQAKEAAVDTFFEVLQEQDPQVVFFEPTRRLKIIVGRLAAREGASVITDVVSFGDEQAKSRYFGGIAMRSAKSLSPIAFYSVPAGTFGDVEATGTDAVREVAFKEPAVALECVSCEELPPAKVDLAAASRVVAAGRGFAAREELDLAYEFCRAIGAELGCTRPLTESEDWLPREAYIGVSGLMLSPEVYVGIGVSGQMQHMVGVDRAGVAFAINKDPHAPIFDKVDYGLVGEITDVLPKINAKLA